MTELLDVLGLDPSDSIVRVIAFALPTAVLLTLLVLLRVKARFKSHKTDVVEHAQPVADLTAAPNQTDAHVPGGEVPPEISGAVDAPALAMPRAAAAPGVDATLSPPEAPSPTLLQSPAASPAQREVPGEKPVAVPATAQHPAAAEPATTAEQPAPSDLTSIKAQFEEAVKSAPKTALAPLYLEYASQCRKSGDEAACLAALRSAAGYGALHGPRVAHAAARVELAEVAYTSGDAIGACEQWQIARLVLHEEGMKDAYARIDKRMRENGCPTDWVLTDF